MLPGSLRFAFQTNWATYVLFASTVISFSTFAALGDLAAAPPLSFQASGCPCVVGKLGPVKAIPKSWLKPAVKVQRSTFPFRMATEVTVGVNVTLSRAASMVAHVEPLLPVSVYWLVLHAAVCTKV